MVNLKLFVYVPWDAEQHIQWQIQFLKTCSVCNRIISEMPEIQIWTWTNTKWSQTWSYGGTKLATFLTTKASPGWKSRTCDGHTLESEQANTINCIFHYEIESNPTRMNRSNVPIKRKWEKTKWLIPWGFGPLQALHTILGSCWRTKKKVNGFRLRKLWSNVW